VDPAKYQSSAKFATRIGGGKFNIQEKLEDPKVFGPTLNQYFGLGRSEIS